MAVHTDSKCLGTPEEQEGIERSESVTDSIDYERNFLHISSKLEATVPEDVILRAYLGQIVAVAGNHARHEVMMTTEILATRVSCDGIRYENIARIDTTLGCEDKYMYL